MSPFAHLPSRVTRHALVPLSLVVACALVYWWRAPLGVVALTGAAFLVLYGLAPSWARHSLMRFDQESSMLVQRGELSGLDKRYARALGMRLFAPLPIVWSRRALVDRHRGRSDRAHRGYVRVVRAYPKGTVPLSVLVAHAHLCYELGAHALAVAAYAECMERCEVLPGVEERYLRSRQACLEQRV